jgi:hypothetical protein
MGVPLDAKTQYNFCVHGANEELKIELKVAHTKEDFSGSVKDNFLIGCDAFSIIFFYVKAYDLWVSFPVTRKMYKILVTSEAIPKQKQRFMIRCFCGLLVCLYATLMRAVRLMKAITIYE